MATPKEIKYKEDRIKGFELMSSVNTTLRNQPFVDTKIEYHEFSHEEQVKYPITKQHIDDHEPPLPQEEQVEHHITKPKQKVTATIFRDFPYRHFLMNSPSMGLLKFEKRFSIHGSSHQKMRIISITLFIWYIYCHRNKKIYPCFL